MQHNDEAPRAAEPGPATEPHGEARGVQLNRRRLVQGAAVGVVPAILTLRSGGVAALSACPGQVAGTATLEKDTGAIQNFSAGVRPNLADAAGDECFSRATACDVDGYVSDATRRSNMGYVKQFDGVYKCTDGTSTGYYSTSATNQNIVILTASSTVSLI